MTVPVLTLDGPGGAGKGTVGKVLAEKLGWHYLDSGSLYRAVALIALREQWSVNDESEWRRRIEQLPLGWRGGRLWCGEDDVTEAIRDEAVSEKASELAAIPWFRQSLVDCQRQYRQLPGLVADGRDMGTSIFPDADVKIFLTATVEERARRRYKQLKEKGINANLSKLTRELAARDERDAARSVSPLKAASDAVVIDTTTKSIEAVTDEVVQMLVKAGLLASKSG